MCFLTNRLHMEVTQLRYLKMVSCDMKNGTFSQLLLLHITFEINLVRIENVDHAQEVEGCFAGMHANSVGESSVFVLPVF